jgi:hypothetical protein
LDQTQQIEEEANAAAEQHAHVKEPTTTTQQLLLRTAGSMKPPERGQRGNGTAASNASDQKQTEPPLHGHPAPASDPREDMMKFRQCDLFLTVLFAALSAAGVDFISFAAVSLYCIA